VSTKDDLSQVSSVTAFSKEDIFYGEIDRRTAVPRALLHDLRTPLNQIIGYGEMLIEQVHDDGADSYVSDLNKIRTAGGMLLALINDNFQPRNTSVYDLGPQQNSVSTEVVRRETAADEETENAVASDCHPVDPIVRSRLLIVDDHEVNRDVLSRRLIRQGHDVASFESGRSALSALRKETYDLVLLDIMMPEMDGYEVLHEIKSDERLRHIPVIMISALQELDSVVRCIEMGADDYLFKPFNPTLLKARVTSCLEKKRARDREVLLFEQLQQNYKRLLEVENQRDNLTHMIVHDLRIPLTSVLSGILTIEQLGELNDGQREMVTGAVAGGEMLLRMVNDLLDVEKLEAGSMMLHYNPISTSDLVLSAISQVSSLIERDHLKLIVEIADDLPEFLGDESKLTRTLVNLLGNAIKFTPSEGTVTVGARQLESQDSVTFYVSDTGEGIRTESFERIFEKFGQAVSSRNGGSMSTGLGLTFCKLAVEAHGGRIGVESSLGKGSTFSFSIPLSISI